MLYETMYCQKLTETQAWKVWFIFYVNVKKKKKKLLVINITSKGCT